MFAEVDENFILSYYNGKGAQVGCSGTVCYHTAVIVFAAMCRALQHITHYIHFRSLVSAFQPDGRIILVAEPVNTNREQQVVILHDYKRAKASVVTNFELLFANEQAIFFKLSAYIMSRSTCVKNSRRK